MQKRDQSTLGLGLVDGHIRIDDVRSLKAEAVRIYLEKSVQVESDTPGDSEDLCGFNVGELRAFWNGFSNLSHCALGLFREHLVKGTPQNECYPTQVCSVEWFEEAIAVLTGLDKSRIAVIRERITLDWAGRKPDVLLQPLVMRNDTVAWSPRFVIESTFVRNMLKLMARSSHLKAQADSVIGNREAGMLRELGSMLGKRGYSYKLNTVIDSDSESGEVDLLAWTNRAKGELLLVEGKALLEPDEINEVDQATEAYLEGQAQLAKCVRVLKAMNQERRQSLFKFVPWNNIQEYLGLVVSPRTLPNNRYDHSCYPGTAIYEMRSRLRPRDYKTPEKLIDALRNRVWLMDVHDTENESVFIEKKFGAVTYEMPGVAVAES